MTGNRGRNERSLYVIWEIILRDFWGDILRDPRIGPRSILLSRLRRDSSSRHTIEGLGRKSLAAFGSRVSTRRQQRKPEPAS
jgi:hypothetical protein